MNGGMEYLQARLQGRYGRRPDAAAWQRLAALRGWPAALAYGREAAFRDWLEECTEAGGTHALERALRRRWRALVAEVAHWMPPQWRAAAEWCAPLPELPAIEHLREGGEVLPWMDGEPALAAVLQGLTFARRPDQSLIEAWLAEWRRRAPHRDEEDAALFGQLERALRAHAAAFRAAAPDAAWPLRQDLQSRLEVLFRRCLFSPAAAFVFLALALLELERLRAAMAPRAILAETQLS